MNNRKIEEKIVIKHQDLDVLEDMLSRNLRHYDADEMAEFLVYAVNPLKYEHIFESWLAQMDLWKIVYTLRNYENTLDVLAKSSLRSAEIFIIAREIVQQRIFKKRQAMNN